MIEHKNPAPLLHSTVSASAVIGLDFSSSESDQCVLAIIDAKTGKVIESGPAVSQNVWNVTVAAIHDFWRGNGHLKSVSPLYADDQKAA